MLVESFFIIYNQVSMSIPNLIHKIKSKTGLDKSTILFLFIIVGVGISSFGLGRLSIDDSLKVKNNITTHEAENLLENKKIDSTENSKIIESIPLQTGEKRYVASKNGKMYYSLGCSGAKRIKPENEVWFSSKTDAEKSGYVLSSTCK